MHDAARPADIVPPPTPIAVRYNAFISYSHAADGRLAPSLRNGLQRFATPWRVFRWINPVRSLRVFQDQASLSANPALWPTIERALASAEWFILLASPEAAASSWVEKEVDFWCHGKSAEKLLIVQTDGEIVWDPRIDDFDWTRTTALSKRLAGAFPYEPRWIDARWARTGAQASLRDPRFRDLVAELAAPLRGIPKDELIGEDIRYGRRLTMLRNAALAVLATLLLLAAIAVLLAFEQRKQALQNRSAALATLADAESHAGSATAVRVALAALPKSLASSRRYAPEAELTLYRALDRNRETRRLVDHADYVTVAEFSPDGRFVLDNSTGLRLLNAATGEQIIAAPEGEVAAKDTKPTRVLSTAFSPDGRNIVTGGYKGSIRFWDAATLKPITPPLGSQLLIDEKSDVLERLGTIDSVAFSPDGRTVAGGSSDKTARLWNVATSREISSPLRHETGVRTVVFSPDGRTLLTGSADGTARLWDVATSSQIRLFGDPGSGPFCNRCAAFSPDGRTIATATRVYQGQTVDEVRLWDAATGEEIGVLRGHEDIITSVVFSPDGGTLLTASWDGTARVWDGGKGAQVLVLRDGSNRLESASFSPDGRTVVTMTNNAVKLWDATPTKESVVLSGHEDQVNSASFDVGGGRIVTTSNDKTVRIWDAATGRQLLSLPGHQENVVEAEFSRDGTKIVSASADRTARVWDASTGQEIAVLRGHEGSVGSAAFSPDGNQIVTTSTATDDRSIRSWDGNGAPLGEPLTFPDAQPMEVSADGRIVGLMETGGGTYWFWDLEANRRLASLRGRSAFLFAGQSPNGEMAVTVDDKYRAQLWDVPREKVIAELRGHKRVAHDAAFSPDGRRVAVAGGGPIARVWDAASGQELAVLRGHEAEVLSVAFGPDGRTLLTAGDRTARVWPVLPRGQELVDLACARVPWPLAEDDKRRFGISDEWCTPEISAELRAKLGLSD